MIWTILILLALFTGLKLAISWLIKNRSSKVASWTIFWMVFVFSGFFMLYAKIKSDEALKQTEIATYQHQMAEEAQALAERNAIEAQRQADIARAQTLQLKKCLEDN